MATTFGMSFISVKGPELLDMYIGETERRVRELFAQAKNRAPCVLFFDELDSLAPARGRGSDGGGVMDRVVSQLITEIDNTISENVFLIGATNRPDLLDPNLLMPGRFNRKVYLSAFNNLASKVQVLTAQTRKFCLDADVDFNSICHRFPQFITGADISDAASKAYFIALQRTIYKIRTSTDEVNNLNVCNRTTPQRKSKATVVKVCHDDFIRAIQLVKPSVSQKVLQDYDNLALKF